MEPERKWAAFYAPVAETLDEHPNELAVIKDFLSMLREKRDDPIPDMHTLDGVIEAIDIVRDLRVSMLRDDRCREAMMVMGEAYRAKAGPLAKPQVHDGGDGGDTERAIGLVFLGIAVAVEYCMLDYVYDWYMCI